MRKGGERQETCSHTQSRLDLFEAKSAMCLQAWWTYLEELTRKLGMAAKERKRRRGKGE